MIPSRPPAPAPPLASAPFLRLRTPGFTHHSLSFSPYYEHRLALASGANFGLVGNGRIHIVDLDRSSPGGVKVYRYFETRDCVFDLAWNEAHENQLVAGCGNGAIKMFDVALEGLPIKAWHEHSAEIMSVDWNNIQKDMFATGSWDQTIKVWTVSRATSLMTIPAHSAQIYSSIFSPHEPSLIASCGSDGYLKIFDIRDPSSTSTASRPALSIPAGVRSPAAGQGGARVVEMLSCDWSKYNSSILATGDKEGAIRIWDIRGGSKQGPQSHNSGQGREVGRHTLAVRKVAWSPHHGDMLASAGYDMTCRVWNTNNPTPSLSVAPGPVHAAHTEFVMALGWALFDPGLLASAAWDEEVHLYRV